MTKKERKEQRRNARRRRRIVVISAAVAVLLIGAGAYPYADHQRSQAVRDLTAIGNATPAVVQVHDPSCPVCTDLRNSVRSIEGDYDDSDLLIRVADLTANDGMTFAAQHGAQSITLVFLDGDGEYVTQVTGNRPSDSIRDLFDRHIAGDL